MEGVILLFLISTGLSGVQSVCDRSSGPSGVTECVAFESYYYQYQWATCLTNTYIRAKSNNKHACRDSTRTYCYYQCMLETYKEESGPVYGACSCKPGDEYREQNLTLPSECYSPSGRSCDWYLECLHKKYPCSETGDDYALTYATKFCKLYEKHYSGFSQDGQKWVDSVRKCLQVSLVPYIRPYSHLSCAEVKTKAFDSHVPCYVKPDEENENVTICNLGLDDWMKILFTIKSSLIMSVESSLESLAGFFTTMKNCASFQSEEILDYATMRNVKLKVDYENIFTRKRRSVDNLRDLKRADDIGNHIADQLGWDKQGVSWFTFGANGSNSELEFNILLANRSHYDLEAGDSQSTDLNEVVDNLQDQLKNGMISSSLPWLTFHALSLSTCEDIDCKNVTELSIAPQKSSIAPRNSSIAPRTSSIAPPTSSIAPRTSSMAPRTSSIAPRTSSIKHRTSSNTPRISSTVPPNSSTAPQTSSTAPPNSSTAPQTSSTAPPNSSTAPQTSSTAPPNSSTAPQTSSTAPPNSSTAPRTSSTAPPNSSTAPQTSSTAPPNSSTAPRTSSIAPPNSSSPLRNSKEVTFSIRQIIAQLILCFLVSYP